MLSTFLFILFTGVALIALAYILALYDICFTFGIEGAAKMVVKNGVFDHAIMWWQGHRLNDPRRLSFDRTKPAGEVIKLSDPTARPSPYAWWQVHWKFFALFGIYWYGVYPFKEIYEYEFKWTEQTVDNNSTTRPWHREEYTSFIFVKNFPYWIKLVAAEDKDNQPLDLDYLLTIHVNNPYKALFNIDDWLARVTADANSTAKMFVGERDFDQIKREKLPSGSTTSEFSGFMIKISTDSITEPGERGSSESYGVTINAASLVEVDIVGDNRAELIRATTAKAVAQRNAEAVIETAKGDAEAVRERARGEADAIDVVYSKVSQFGPQGVVLQGLDAIKESAKSPGATIVWANNPLPGFAEALAGIVKDLRSSPAPTNPAAPTTPPTTP